MDARPDDDAGADDAAAAQPAADDVTGPGDDHSAAPPDPADAPPQPTDDEVWASLVARLSDVDVPDEQRGARVVRSAARDEPRADPDADAPALPPELSGRDWDGTSQYDEAEADVDDLEHFVPQDPGPVLGGDPLLTLAWTAAVGVPLFLLVVVVAWRDAPPLLVRTAVGLFVAAVAVLVWRMPHRRDPSDDDGAVV